MEDLAMETAAGANETLMTGEVIKQARNQSVI